MTLPPFWNITRSTSYASQKHTSTKKSCSGHLPPVWSQPTLPSNVPTFPYQLYHPTSILDSLLIAHWHGRHIDSVARKVSKKIGALKRAGNAMTRDTRRKYYLAVVQLDLQYGSNAFWTALSNTRKNRLIRASKRGMRAVVDAPTTTSTSSIIIITFKHCFPWKAHAV